METDKDKSPILRHIIKHKVLTKIPYMSANKLFFYRILEATHKIVKAKKKKKDSLRNQQIFHIQRALVAIKE